MAAQFTWNQDSGNPTGVPARGGNRGEITAMNYKSIDNINSDVSGDPGVPGSYAANPIRVGDNSFTFYLFAQWSGSWNQIFNIKFGHSDFSTPAGVSIFGKVSSIYNQPSAFEDTTLTTNVSQETPLEDFNFSSEVFDVLLAYNGPEDSVTTNVADSNDAPANIVFSQYIVTQMRTTVGVIPGELSPITWTLRYDEN